MKCTHKLALFARGGLPSVGASVTFRVAVCLALMGCLGWNALAAQIDIDPLNNVQATADPLPLAAPGAAIANRATLALPDNDVDFFSVPLAADDVLLGMTTPIENVPTNLQVPDTLASVFDAGVMRTFSDDDGTDFPPVSARGSIFRFQATRTGVHHVGVTGYYDGEFDGAATGDPHPESGRYWLTLGRVNPAVAGGGFLDTDPANQTIAGADAIVLPPATHAAVAVSRLAAGDVDFYRLNLLAGDVLSAMTAPLADLSATYSVPDTMMALFNSSGTQIAFNDDAGDIGSDPAGVLASDSPFDADVGIFGSAIRASITAPGTYYLAVTGFGDNTVIGNHGEAGSYALLVGVPEPASVVLFAAGMAALVAAAFRRRRRA